MKDSNSESVLNDNENLCFKRYDICFSAVLTCIVIGLFCFFSTIGCDISVKNNEEKIKKSAKPIKKKTEARTNLKPKKLSKQAEKKPKVEPEIKNQVLVSQFDDYCSFEKRVERGEIKFYSMPGDPPDIYHHYYDADCIPPLRIEPVKKPVEDYYSFNKRLACDDIERYSEVFLYNLPRYTPLIGIKDKIFSNTADKINIVNNNIRIESFFNTTEEESYGDLKPNIDNITVSVEIATTGKILADDIFIEDKKENWSIVTEVKRAKQTDELIENLEKLPKRIFKKTSEQVMIGEMRAKTEEQGKIIEEQDKEIKEMKKEILSFSKKIS